MAIPINWTGEYSSDVVEAEIFSKWKMRIGSAHGEMLMEVIIKKKKNEK